MRRSVSLLTLLATAASAIVLVTAAPASAQFQTFSDASISQPVGMAAAPDGSLWFANSGNDSIGRIDPTTGTVTNFTAAGIDGPRSVTVAPNGVVWFSSTENGRLGKVEAGTVTVYDVAMDQIDDVEVAADGDIWFNGFPGTGDLRIGRFEPDTLLDFTYDVPGTVLRMTPHVTDGMWFIWFNPAFSTARIRHITVAGALTGFSTGTIDDPSDLTSTPDGRLWFTGEDDDRVGRLNPATGATASFGLAPELISPNEIIVGPGGDLWFSIRAGGRFGRLDPDSGTIVTYRDPTDTVEGPIGLAVGGDGNLWYTRAIDLVGRLDLGSCGGEEVTVDLRLGSRPTAADDVILGRPVADTINAGAGDDLICALGGDDTVSGGAGRDVVDLGPGADQADSDSGNDRVSGGTGADLVLLGSGVDQASGGVGGDLLFGEDGADVLAGDGGDDSLSGGNGSDTCNGGLGRDTGVSCESTTGIP